MALLLSMIPKAIIRFVPFIANMGQKLMIWGTSFGITDDQRTAVQTAATNLATMQNEVEQARINYLTLTESLKAQYAAAYELAREIIRQMAGCPNWSQQAAEAFLVADPSGSHGGYDPNDRPVLVAFADIGRVRLDIRVAESESRACKPEWARVVLVYRKKEGESEFRMIGTATRSPFVDEDITGPAAQYSYRARYQGTRPDELSVWSSEFAVAARADVAA